MTELIKYVIGIDIAKDKFDTCLMSMDVELNYKVKATRKFSNNPCGYQELLGWMDKHCKGKTPRQSLLEASGVYHEQLAIFLTDKGKKVFVVLPNKARKYMQSLGYKSKNDKIDAQGLALMCAQQKFDPWQPISKFYYQLRLLTRHFQSTQESKTAIMNQHHALQHSGYPSKEVNKQLEKTIAFYNNQVKETKQYIINHVSSNEEVKRKIDQICVIKGLDVLSVATILAETNGFELFKNKAQLISYAGYDVIENSSGNHVGKTKISKKGNSRIRRILHMPAFNVVKYKETAFANLHERVYTKTKIKMKAYVAVQKKILIVIHSLWKKDEAYQKQCNIVETSGNEESRAFFPLNTGFKTTNQRKKIVPLKSDTTQDELRYKESSEALFPYNKLKKINLKKNKKMLAN